MFLFFYIVAFVMCVSSVFDNSLSCQADEIFIQCIREAGLYDTIWQALAAILPGKSVGVQGDQRTHCHMIGLRAVTSEDGMTADW